MKSSWIIIIVVMCSEGLSARAADVLPITPFLGASHNYECGSLELGPANVIGYLALPDEGGTVRARVLYRGAGRASASLQLRLMREDGEALRGEIDALLRRLRARPLRFLARRQANGDCEIYRISG